MAKLKKEPKRDFAAEKEKVYSTCLAIVRARPRREKKNRIPLSEIVKASGLSKAVVANSLKWLKRKALVSTEEGKDGWLVQYVPPKKIANFCWRHGIFKEAKGRGKKRQVLCPKCERSRKEGKAV